MSDIIFCTGTLYLAVHIYGVSSDENIVFEKEYLGENYHATLGGSGINVARYLSLIDSRSYFLGKIGSDLVGRMVKHLLREEKFPANLISASKASTSLAVNIVNDNSNKLMFSGGTSNNTFQVNDVLNDLKRIGSVKALYIGGFFKLTSIEYKEMVKLFNYCHLNKIPVFLDHGRVTSTLSPKRIILFRKTFDLMGENDYYLPSEKEFLKVWGYKSVEDGLDNIYKKENLKKTTIVVKRDKNGASYFHSGSVKGISGFPQKPLNTAGAGDAFNAGFIKSILNRNDLKATIRYANAVAACKVVSKNFSSNTIKDFLKKNKYILDSESII